jgi:hypothetical protein
VTELRLDIDALVGRVAAGDAVWAMVLRRHRAPPLLARPFAPLLARWRRQRRRRAGWSPGRISLRVVDGRVDLLVRGATVACLPACFPEDHR